MPAESSATVPEVSSATPDEELTATVRAEAEVTVQAQAEGDAGLEPAPRATPATLLSPEEPPLRPSPSVAPAESAQAAVEVEGGSSAANAAGEVATAETVPKQRWEVDLELERQDRGDSAAEGTVGASAPRAAASRARTCACARGRQPQRTRATTRRRRRAAGDRVANARSVGERASASAGVSTPTTAAWAAWRHSVREAHFRPRPWASWLGIANERRRGLHGSSRRRCWARPRATPAAASRHQPAQPRRQPVRSPRCGLANCASTAKADDGRVDGGREAARKRRICSRSRRCRGDAEEGAATADKDEDEDDEVVARAPRTAVREVLHIGEPPTTAA